MIPAAIFGILAISRLGAIHTVVFGGFAPASLAQRIEASRPRAIMTASCGIEGSKGPMNYKSFIEGALQKSRYKPKKIIVWQREQLRWHPILKERGERSWQGLLKSARNRGVRAEAVPVKSSDGIYIIYTSGTTGLPKGVLREAGGHAVGLNFSIKYLFGIHGPGDVIFCASDLGYEHTLGDDTACLVLNLSLETRSGNTISFSTPEICLAVQLPSWKKQY